MLFDENRSPREFAVHTLEEIRQQFETAFHPDTASQGSMGDIPSTGHCAVAAIIVQNIIGGDFVSASVNGISHWFNRVCFRNSLFDIDLTADQFGGPPILIADADCLYPETRIRTYQELTTETLIRAARFAHRARFNGTEIEISATIKARLPECE